MNSHYIVALSWPWVWIGMAVCYLFGKQLVAAIWQWEFDRTFPTILGIFLGWCGGAVIIRPWYTVWRIWHDRDPDAAAWMLTHETIPIGTIMVLMGGALHVRTATVARYGEWAWLITSAGGVLALFAGLYVK